MITLRIILTRALIRVALREIAEGEVSDHPIELRAFCRAELGEQQ